MWLNIIWEDEMSNTLFQDIDLEAAFEAVAAFSQTVHPSSDHAQLMTQAIKTAILEEGVGHLV
ncbi:MAG: hypothetical protein AAFQ67_08970, partial [Pseudomonadota bacterium]